MFLDEEIPNINHVKNPKDLIKTIYCYYIKNQKFIDATLASAGKELFFEFIYNNCYSSFFKMLDIKPEAHILSINDKKSIARFYAGGYAYYIVYYLSFYKNKSEEGLLSMLNFLPNDIIEESIQHLLKIKKEQ